MKNVSRTVSARSAGCCHRNRAPASSSRQAPAASGDPDTGPPEDPAPEAPGVAVPDGVAEQPAGTGPAGARESVAFLAARGQFVAYDEHPGGGDGEAGRVDPDGAGGAEQRGDQAGQQRACDPGCRLRRVEQAVGLGDPGRAGQGRDHGHVADLEDHADRRAGRQDHVQEPHLRVEGPGQRDEAVEDHPGQVAGRHQEPAVEPVGQDPGEDARDDHRGAGQPRSAGPSARPTRSPAAPAAGPRSGRTSPRRPRGSAPPGRR